MPGPSLLDSATSSQAPSGTSGGVAHERNLPLHSPARLYLVARILQRYVLPDGSIETAWVERKLGPWTLPAQGFEPSLANFAAIIKRLVPCEDGVWWRFEYLFYSDAVPILSDEGLVEAFHHFREQHAILTQAEASVACRLYLTATTKDPSQWTLNDVVDVAPPLQTGVGVLSAGDVTGHIQYRTFASEAAQFHKERGDDSPPKRLRRSPPTVAPQKQGEHDLQQHNQYQQAQYLHSYPLQLQQQQQHYLPQQDQQHQQQFLEQQLHQHQQQQHATQQPDLLSLPDSTFNLHMALSNAQVSLPPPSYSGNLPEFTQAPQQAHMLLSVPFSPAIPGLSLDSPGRVVTSDCTTSVSGSMLPGNHEPVQLQLDQQQSDATTQPAGAVQQAPGHRAVAAAARAGREVGGERETKTKHADGRFPNALSCLH